MTAVTVVEAYDNTLTSEGYLKFAYLTGEPNVTFTPANSSGKTIRILSCYTTSGTAVFATVSNGVVTFGSNLGDGDTFTILYTLT